MPKSRLMLGTATAALSLVLLSHPSSAQSLDDVTRRLDRLEQENAQLKQQAAAPAPAGLGQVYAADLPTKVLACGGHGFLERKKGEALTFYTCGGEFTAYGNFNVSLDDTTKDLKTMAPSSPPGPFDPATAAPPSGNFGWMLAVSTNLSYLGARGFERVGNYPFNFVYQFEVGMDITATPGLRQTNNQLSDTVNGALFNRNTYIGIASDWGAIKIGKSDGPYKNSTAQFNPFAGMIGDYAVVMGNTGGDNRVEFGTRLDRAIWYESPVVKGFQFNFMFAPGQNRDLTSGDIPAGGSDCAGGNDPTSGGNLPVLCNDGGFSNAISTNLSYTNGGFYATVAYEWHQNVNRQSDISTAIYGGAGASPNGYVPPSALAGQLFNDDVANEDAFKVGALYRFPTKTTIGGIFEMMHRYVPADLAFQNERTRNGTGVFLSQQLNATDSVHFGWAHAFKTPGDPGQHNDALLTTPDGLGFFATNDNAADMITAAFRRNLSSNLSWYTNVAATINGPSAHYDLGAGGRGVTTDCHDTFGATGAEFSAPRCWTGATLFGVSSGLQWRF